MIKKILLFFLLLVGAINIVSAQTEEAFFKAEQLFANRSYEQAKPLYEKLYLSPDYQSLVFQHYISTLIKLKNFAEAEKIIKKSIKEDPQNPSLKVQLGFLYQEKGNAAEAEKLYLDAIKNLPADQQKINHLATIFYEAGNYNYVVKTFLNGRKTLNNEDLFSLELINIYRYLRNKDGLTTELLKAINTNPQLLNMAKSSLARSLESPEDYQNLKTLILSKIQKDPQNLALTDLLAWTYLQLKEYDMALIQIIALDRRTNDNGSKVYSLSRMLADNNEFEAAAKGYNYILSKGNSNAYYVAAQVEMLKTKQKQLNQDQVKTSDIVFLENSYQQLISDYGKNSRTLFAIRELAKLKASKLNTVEEAESLLEEAINFKGISNEELAETKIALADIYVQDKNIWDASLLLSQVEKSFPGDPIGQEAKFKNAKLSFYNGDFKWAKAQLDVLKASTSQLIANDALDLSLLIQDNLQQDSTGEALKVYARAEFLRFQNQPENALKVLDSLSLKYPNNELADDILLSKARIFVEQNKVTLAIENYKELVEKYSNSIWADDGIYSLGVIYEDKLKQKEEAIKYYQKLIESFPGSLFVIDARKRFRNLRGDAL